MNNKCEGCCIQMKESEMVFGFSNKTEKYFYLCQKCHKNIDNIPLLNIHGEKVERCLDNIL